MVMENSTLIKKLSFVIIIGGSLHSHMSMLGGIVPHIHVLCAIVVGHSGAKIIMGDALNFEL